MRAVGESGRTAGDGARTAGQGGRAVRVVAFGGGHGLSAALRALRIVQRDVPLDITAVVTVADDGGSSGRLRATRDILPPGDLRQALAALADETGTADLFQHRFTGADDIAGHPVGNLVLCALMELAGDPVVALDRAAQMLRCGGRVLPMSRDPLHIEADLSEGDEVVTVRGQHEVAVTAKTIDRVRLTPAEPEACAEAVRAVLDADWLLFGPGSWFTSVIPHLLVPGLAAAIQESRAHRLVTLNLAADSETAGLTLPEHLAALRRYLPGLRVDVVLADGNAVGDPEPVHRAAESLGARLVLAPVAVGDGAPRHDPRGLAVALEPLLRTGARKAAGAGRTGANATNGGVTSADAPGAGAGNGGVTGADALGAGAANGGVTGADALGAGAANGGVTGADARGTGTTNGGTTSADATGPGTTNNGVTSADARGTGNTAAGRAGNGGRSGARAGAGTARHDLEHENREVTTEWR